MEDYIRRQDVLKEIWKVSGHLDTDMITRLYIGLNMLPSVQPEAKTTENVDCVTLNKDKILEAGMEGREVDFRIGGRLFAIREKAQ